MVGRYRPGSPGAIPVSTSPCSAPRSTACPSPTSATIVTSASAIRGGRQPAGEILAVDLTLYPGFSGGPLVDVLGRVIGITTSGVSRHLQCAVRAATVTRLAEHVVRGGKIPRAYLGVGTQPVMLPDHLRERLS